MELATLSIEQDEMVELKRRYAKPKDDRARAMATAMQSIIEGHVVVDFAESVMKAGIDRRFGELPFTVPRLAICHAGLGRVRVELMPDGTAIYRGGAKPDKKIHTTASLQWGWLPTVDVPWHPFNRRWGERESQTVEAAVPLVPEDIYLGGKTEHGAFLDYHIIWEPVWESVPLPEDPILCKRIGETLLFVEVAHWDITPLESRILNGTW